VMEGFVTLFVLPWKARVPCLVSFFLAAGPPDVLLEDLGAILDVV
jgi:hypothetical protein